MNNTLTPDEENERNHFNELAKHGYAWWGSRTSVAKARMQRRINLLRENLDIKPGNKILELGCGCGDFTIEVSNILDNKTLIYGVDLSEEQIKLAKERVTKTNVFLSVGNCTHSAFENNLFNFIIGKSVLHHLDLDKALKEIERILIPGGKIFFIEPNIHNPQVWLQYHVPFLRKLNQASPNENPFHSSTLKEKLQDLNFKNISIEPFDFIHPLIPEKLLGLAQKIEKVLEKTILKRIAANIVITAEKG